MTALPNWPRHQGDCPGRAQLRATEADFVVQEVLPFAPDGEGEHSLLYLRKTGLNTADVVRQLAGFAGIAERDIGVCGLKDKHAVTSQWFSLGLAGRPEPAWDQFTVPGIEILERHRHRKKLRRGVHRANLFELRLREVEADIEQLLPRLQRISRQGVPNYFGPQRFGNQGNNLRHAQNWFSGSGRAPRRNQRSLYLSAVRSFLFNELLAERVGAQTWQTPEMGDTCLLAGSHSRFVAGIEDTGLESRAAALDIHLGLPLYGASGESLSVTQQAVLDRHASLCQGLLAQELRLDWRAARLIADDFCWQFCDDGSLLLRFELEAGGYATAVLRELLDTYETNTRPEH
ncbi:tRNA pseudouridine(13) synthase TruD [Halieaceae bacterium IMCC14734]|uniref:tRNA pseudouridine synthase D n=1 Tax=Candidatus Litorirhabdus singularis TaxID=2518993 RepID=A0ABT3TIJ2_9GAMM|nr:tRNA pseudouridine(13) synthase TruD [Candidatus Litorirhabdus singularis]MCX2982132.1 tRNA pseudouridine(13) synthase TruD [Candidatus Litorirhabdus singularis]